MPGSTESGGLRRWLLRLAVGLGVVVAAGAGSLGAALVVTGADTDAFVQTLNQPADLPLAMGQTSVLMLSACTLRANRLGFYGGKNPTSPLMDSWAARSVVFDRHIAQAPWTKPSMGALLTGRYPRILKVDTPLSHDRLRQVIRDDATFLSERLHDAGYTTISSVANPNLKEQFGFGQGFDHITEYIRRADNEFDYPSADEVTDAALAHLAAVPDGEPVYLRVSMFDGHDPIQYRRLDWIRMDHESRQSGEYDAALRNVDRNTARLITAVRAARPNTLVILAADHGEGLRLPEHHGRGHGNHLYQTTIGTPWVLSHPALPARRVGGLSMNIDVVPTVLDLLGAPVAADLDGSSQAAVALGHSGDPVHEFVFSETFFRRTHVTTVLDADFQLIRSYAHGAATGPHTDRLFSATDWRAEVELTDTRPEARDRLAQRLSEWEALQAESVVGAAEPLLVDADPGMAEALKALGYVE